MATMVMCHLDYNLERIDLQLTEGIVIAPDFKLNLSDYSLTIAVMP
jgi:hypothetical protein